MGKIKNGIKEECYFKELFCHGYFLASLLVSTLMITLLVANFDLHILTAVKTVKNLSLYLGIASGVVALFVLIYMLGKIRCTRLSVADTIGFSLILTGIGAALYFILTLKKFDQTGITRIVVAGVIFVLGLAYLFFRLAFFKAHERRRIIYIKNSLTGYFSLIGQKYSFMSVVITALVASSVMHLIMTKSFANYVACLLVSDVEFMSIMIAMAVCFVLYLVIEVSNKHVNPVDLLLSSGTIFFPITVLNCVLLKEDYVNALTIVAIVFAVYLLLFIVRIMCFDITIPEKHDKKRFSDVLLAVVVSALLVGGAVLLLQTNAVASSIKVIGELNTINCISFLPVLLIALTIGLASLFNLVIAVTNINSRKLNGADIFSDISFLTSIFAFSILTVFPTITTALILGGLFLMNLAVFIARKRALYSKK